MKTTGTHVVGVGGGTGLSVLLDGLRRCAQDGIGEPLEISAIVSVADDGGSTGNLRNHLGIPAVGDLRNCIVALAHGEPLWNELFQHRFAGGNGLDGHSLGNLIVAALAQRAGGLNAAIDRLQQPLRLKGRVLPVTERGVTLCAEMEGGEIVMGESKIPRSGRPVERVWLHPGDPEPADGVLESIADASAIVLGPGSLYTSIIPNLLVRGLPEAIRSSPALKIFVCNIMTQPGETDGFDACDHLAALEPYLGAGTIDVCLLDAVPPSETDDQKPAVGSEPVSWNRRRLTEAGTLPLPLPLHSRGPTPGRHDPVRLGRIVISLARSLKRRDTPETPLEVPPIPSTRRFAVQE